MIGAVIKCRDTHEEKRTILRERQDSASKFGLASGIEQKSGIEAEWAKDSCELAQRSRARNAEKHVDEVSCRWWTDVVARPEVLPSGTRGSSPFPEAEPAGKCPAPGPCALTAIHVPWIEYCVGVRDDTYGGISALGGAEALQWASIGAGDVSESEKIVVGIGNRKGGPGLGDGAPRRWGRWKKGVSPPSRPTSGVSTLTIHSAEATTRIVPLRNSSAFCGATSRRNNQIPVIPERPIDQHAFPTTPGVPWTKAHSADQGPPPQ
ncbi:hypothetical protein KM043_009247 [Ampulex compressa]|nr:hypothetical protein KM043_009247 [Ampulex compressa]